MWIKEAFETNVLRGQELSALISNVSVLFNWLYKSIKYLNHYCLFGNFIRTKDIGTWRFIHWYCSRKSHVITCMTSSIDLSYQWMSLIQASNWYHVKNIVGNGLTSYDNPVDRRRKLNVHKTFIRRSGRLLIKYIQSASCAYGLSISFSLFFLKF